MVSNYNDGNFFMRMKPSNTILVHLLENDKNN
jgi:hypothetical protein